MTLPASLKPRDYQQAIFQTSINNNTLVVLPTGLGKTLIALLLSIDRLKKHTPSKVLFLAPTRPLVEQHFQTFTSQLPELFADLQLFTGSVPAEKRKKIFKHAEIIFSTPQCISNDLDNSLYDLNDVSLIVFDEAHRCLKNYAYTSVVNHYKQQSRYPRILGLTASPGSDSSKIKEICSHLNINEIEIRTRDSIDVKPYLKERKFTKIEVPFPKEFEEIRTLLQILYNQPVDKLREKNLLFGPANKVSLLKLQAKLASQVSQRNFTAMHGMSQTAQAIKISHALELLETQTLSGLNTYLQSLLKQANQKQSRAVQILVKKPEFNATLISLQQLIATKTEHPKIQQLAKIISSQFSVSPKSKVIIFAQFRETILTLTKKLNEIKGINAKVFLGQAKKDHKDGTSGLNQKEQKAIIEEFKANKINVLCATSIGEEGLDIPEVSAVIFYEPIPSAIRKIQRAGRTARLNPGKLIILMTKDTRDIAYHYASSAREKKMYKSLESVKADLKKPKTLSDFK